MIFTQCICHFRNIHIASKFEIYDLKNFSTGPSSNGLVFDVSWKEVLLGRNVKSVEGTMQLRNSFQTKVQNQNHMKKNPQQFNHVCDTITIPYSHCNFISNISENMEYVAYVNCINFLRRSPQWRNVK